MGLKTLEITNVSLAICLDALTEVSRIIYEKHSDTDLSEQLNKIIENLQADCN